MKLKYEENLEKQETWIHQLSEDIIKIKDEMRGKDLAIQALTNTLLDKGDEN